MTRSSKVDPTTTLTGPSFDDGAASDLKTGFIEPDKKACKRTIIIHMNYTNHTYNKLNDTKRYVMSIGFKREIIYSSRWADMDSRVTAPVMGNFCKD